MNATMIEAAVVRETEDETDETHVIGKIDPLRWWFADASGPRISYQCPYGAPARSGTRSPRPRGAPRRRGSGRTWEPTNPKRSAAP
jgi:hypothetical protein